MPKTARQLDREIAEALDDHPQTQAITSSRFTIHGADRGVNKVAYAKTPAEADRIARAMAGKGFLITVLAQDPITQEYRAVMVSNRENGKMKIQLPDASFARAARHSDTRRTKRPGR